MVVHIMAPSLLEQVITNESEIARLKSEIQQKDAVEVRTQAWVDEQAKHNGFLMPSSWIKKACTLAGNNSSSLSKLLSSLVDVSEEPDDNEISYPEMMARVAAKDDGYKAPPSSPLVPMPLTEDEYYKLANIGAGNVELFSELVDEIKAKRGGSFPPDWYQCVWSQHHLFYADLDITYMRY